MTARRAVLQSLVLTRNVSRSLNMDLTINIGGWNRPLSTDANIPPVQFSDPKMYSRQTGAAEDIFKDVIKFSGQSGIDKAGGFQVRLDSGLHKGNSKMGGDMFQRTTGEVTDKDGKTLFFYRNDGTFWNRIHFPSCTDANNEFENHKYVEISKEEFDNLTPPVNPKFD